MKRGTQILFAALLALSAPAMAATVREISASELRQIVKAGQAVSLKRAIDAVSTSIGGEPIEARAFEADGVFYRIVVKRSNGKLVSVIIDAGTGRQVSKESSIGKEISAAAASGNGPGTGKGKDKTPGGQRSAGNAGGNGNAGGGGNSGGSGGGNGNGGGNSGSNGNGGGGNGNGKN
jgi:hypothetical protein